jgi:hypothetical protein
MSGWYICRNNAVEGPHPTQKILQELLNGKILWTDGVWGAKIGGEKWVRICDVPTFRATMPTLPPPPLLRALLARILKKGAKGASAPANSALSFLEGLAPLRTAVSALVKKLSGPSAPATEPSEVKGGRAPKSPTWYLQFEGSEFGPLTLREALLILKSGKLKGVVRARKEGTSQWFLTDVIPELAPDPKAFRKMMEAKPHLGEDKRKNARAALLAEVHFSSGDGRGDPSVYSGICRDISVRGMLILTTRCPTSAGAKVKLDVVPLKNQGLDSFVCMAEIVRILPEKNGFSVQFDKMPEAVLAALTKYVSGSG